MNITRYLSPGLAALGLAALGLAAPATAGPVLFDITFGLLSPNPVPNPILPTAGSFDFDSTVSKNPFSSVLITWDGISFDDTAPLNLSFNSTPSASFSATTIGGTWDADIQTGCQPTPSLPCGILDLNPRALDLAYVSSETSSLVGGLSITPETVGVFTAVPATSSAAPEPATFPLILGGLALLAWTRRQAIP
jgi:hypothetical protein